MWLNKWVHKLFLQCRPRSFFNLKPMSVIVYQFQTVKFIQMVSFTFGLFTQVSGSGTLGPLVFLLFFLKEKKLCLITKEIGYRQICLRPTVKLKSVLRGQKLISQRSVFSVNLPVLASTCLKQAVLSLFRNANVRNYFFSVGSKYLLPGN